MRIASLCIIVALVGLAGIQPARAKKISLGQSAVGSSLDSCEALIQRKKYTRAIECLEVFRSRNKGNEAGQTADLLIGDAYFSNKEYLLAADTYDVFLKNFPDHPRADYASYRVGASYLAEAPKQIDRDQHYLQQATTVLQRHLERFPRSTYNNEVATQLNTALQRLGDREYLVGKFYYRTGEYRAALPHLLTVLTEYPRSTERGKIYWQAVHATAALGDLDNAKHLYTQMQQDLPADAYTKKAERYLLRQAQSTTP